MMQDHEDPKYERWLQDAAQSYNAPPRTPSEQMWARIAAERQRRAGRVIELRPWMRWAVAAAAMLAVGIGIGRWTATSAGGAGGAGGGSRAVPAIATIDREGPDVAHQVAATQYLSRTEAFLTAFREDLPSESRNARFAIQARELLTTTRLMLDSRAADDPRIRVLLEDLELLLVQISQLGASRGPNDSDFITQGMDRSNVLPKLRSAIPAGPVAVRTEGAL